MNWAVVRGIRVELPPQGRLAQPRPRPNKEMSWTQQSIARTYLPGALVSHIDFPSFAIDTLADT
jgi:hypothetical protein